jgi:hypothetical protein
MKRSFPIYILFVLQVLTFNLEAQTKDSLEIVKDTNRRMIQFSGAVVTADSLKPVRYAHIFIKNEMRGGAANAYGFFSFIAHTGDTIVFSAQGFRTSYYAIPDTLSSSHYSMYQMMQTDTILLKETVIYPWPTVEALEYAIVNSEIPETDYDRAMRNLEREAMKELGLKMHMDGTMNYRNQIQGVVRRSYYNGQYQPISLLNPFAWAEFFKAWEEGKFKRKDKDD